MSSAPNFGEAIRCSSHMLPYLDPSSLEKYLSLAEQALRIQADQFDSIAFRGMSGALLGPPLAMRLNKGMLLVRKSNDNSHSSFRVEGFIGCKRYVIVDDFVSSKNTINNIVECIYNNIGTEAVCVGVLEVTYLSQEDIERKESVFSYVDHVTARIDSLKENDTHTHTQQKFDGTRLPVITTGSTALTLYTLPKGMVVYRDVMEVA